MSGIIGTLFSRKYTITKETSVAIMKGGIAVFKLFSPLKYMIKKIRRGPKSVVNLIMGLYIVKC